MSTLYDTIYGSGTPTTNVNYISTTPSVSYPDASFTNVSGTMFLPRIYGKDLTYLEIGSSGKIAVTLTDIHSFDISNNSNVVNFTAAGAQAFAIKPKDSNKTTTLGDFTTYSSTSNYQELDTIDSLGFRFRKNVAITGSAALNGDVQVGGNLAVNSNTTLGGTLAVTSASTFSSTVSVAGATSLQSSLAVTGPTTLSSTLSVASNSTFSSAVTVVGTTSLQSNLVVTGPTSLNSTLAVANASTFNSTVGVVGATSLQSTLAVTGPTTLSSTLAVASNSTFSSAVAVVGTTSLQSNLIVTGPTSLNSTLAVASNSTFSSAVAVVGTTSLQSNLVVTGPTSLNSTLDVASNSTFSSAVAVVGTTSLQSNLVVTGPTSLNSTLAVASNSTFSSAVAVVGTTSLQSNLVVTGPTSLNSTLAVASASTFSSTVAVVGTTSLQSNLVVTGPTSLNSTLAVASNSTFSSAVAVVGTTSLQSNLVVTGPTNLNSTLSVASNSTFSSAVAVTGPTNLNSSLTVVGSTVLDSNLLVLGPSTFSNSMTVTGAANFTSNISVKDLSISGIFSFVGQQAATFSNLVVTGTSLLTGNVSISNNLLLQGNANLNGSLNLLGAAAFSNTLNVVGVSTFNNTANFGVSSTGSNLASVYVGIGTATPLVSLDLSTRHDALGIPVGTTAARPSVPATGYVRYNTDLSTFEGYGSSTWGTLGGVVSVNKDTYISAENFPGANNEQLKFVTSNVQRMIIGADGSVGIGTDVNPIPGDYTLYVKGKTNFNSTSVVMNQNLIVGSTVTSAILAVSDSAGISNNLTVGGQIVTHDLITGGDMTLTASNIVLKGNVQITGALQAIATNTITVEDLYITLASSGQPAGSSNIRRDGGLNDSAGFVVEGIPAGFQSNTSNVKYYEKSIRWKTGGSNGVQSYDKSTKFSDDPYFETLGGSFQISRYTSNMGYDFVTGSSYDVAKISFMLRINANEELEIIKVRETSAGVRTGKVVQRLGVNMPLLNV